MRINSSDAICGISIILVRNFLRRSSQLPHWRAEYIASLLKMDENQTVELLIELEERGFIEKAELAYAEQYWRNTIHGNALGGASAAKPYKRKTSEKALAEFMERVQKVNSDPYYLYKVTRVILFGSYTTDALEVNDVDIALELAPKEEDIELRGVQLAKRRDEAVKRGKRFNNILEWAGVAELEVWSFLKSRSRILSLHLATEELHELVGGKVIFDEASLL